MNFNKPMTEWESWERKKLDDIIVGLTPAILEIKRQVLCLSKSDLTVCISGESGTGKEIAAHAIHKLSIRKDKPFVKINCAAIPPTLFESEMFGFERGTFTGAFQKKRGKFELAHSGTIFLDEITEVPLSAQGKLLHVLEDKEVSALGSTTNTRIDARVLAATNANLGEMVSQGRFRLDLYYRLNVVSIDIPPLRERKDDIELLCDHFLRKYSASARTDCKLLGDRICKQLHEYSWPGNVRELENLIRTNIAIGKEESFQDKLKNVAPSGTSSKGTGPMMTADALSGNASWLLTRYSLKELCREVARKAETDAIVDALSYTQWNRSKAAALLQISYKTLLNKIKEYEHGIYAR
jgi:two-component system response regulator AtoC